MKVLLLSLALLFFTGAQGRHFWQQDAPAKEETGLDVISEILSEGFEMVSGVFERLDLKAIANDYQLKEKLDTARKHASDLEKAVDDYLDEVWKQFDKKFQEKFPVLSKNVVPIFKEFEDVLEDQLEKIVEEVVPHATSMLSEISKNVIRFFQNLESAAEKGVENIHAEIDSLREKLKPYVHEVRAEYERYHKDLQGEFNKDYKELRQKVEKNIEKLREQAKPQLENIRSKLPDGDDIQEKFDKLLKEIKEYILNSE